MSQRCVDSEGYKVVVRLGKVLTNNQIADEIRGNSEHKIENGIFPSWFLHKLWEVMLNNKVEEEDGVLVVGAGEQWPVNERKIEVPA
jgi:hypothetical protein